jgi:hypothetical protein
MHANGTRSGTSMALMPWRMFGSPKAHAKSSDGDGSRLQAQIELANPKLIQLALLMFLLVASDRELILLFQGLHFLQLNVSQNPFLAQFRHSGLGFAQIQRHTLLQVEQLDHELALVHTGLHAKGLGLGVLFFEPVFVVHVAKPLVAGLQLVHSGECLTQFSLQLDDFVVGFFDQYRPAGSCLTHDFSLGY